MSVTAEQVVRPGATAWTKTIRAEAKMVVRDTAGLIVPLGMPLLILTMQAISIDDAGQEVAEGVTVLSLYALPIVLTMVVAMTAVINMPSFLATYRRTRLLRRLAVTPASPAMVLVAQVVVSLVQILVGTTVALAVSFLFFSATFPLSVLTAVGVLFACCAAMYGLGMIVASVAPTPNSAVAFGLVVFFAIAALGGMFGGMQNLPESLQQIGVWMPFGAAVEGLQQAWLGEPVTWQIWLTLGGWTVLGGGVAALLFRWE